MIADGVLTLFAAENEPEKLLDVPVAMELAVMLPKEYKIRLDILLLNQKEKNPLEKNVTIRLSFDKPVAIDVWKK